MDHQYFATGALATALRAAKFSGLELLEATTREGKRSGWWQLIARHELPKLAPETRGIERDRAEYGCPVCDRDNFFHSLAPSELAYRRAEANPARLPDVSKAIGIPMPPTGEQMHHPPA